MQRIIEENMALRAEQVKQKNETIAEKNGIIAEKEAQMHDLQTKLVYFEAQKTYALSVDKREKAELMGLVEEGISLIMQSKYTKAQLQRHFDS